MPRRRITHGWGGSRQGAGRKPILKDKARITLDLERSDREALQRLAKKERRSVADLIRQAVAALLRRKRR